MKKTKETKSSEENQFIDPPSGWKFGFPRILPKEVKTEAQLKKWLLEVGYPEKDIELALKYSRYWNE